MMGEHPEQGVSGFYEALALIFLTLLGVALVTGASAALADQSTTEEPAVQTLGGDLGVQVNEEVESPRAEVLASDDIVAIGEDVVITEDGIDLDDARLEGVEVLTAQVGDAAPGDGREEMDIAIVVEESLAMQTHWGTYYPVSNTVEYAADNTNVMTKSTVDEVESQSWTAIGDLLGIGLEVSGVYEFDCDIEERYTKEWPPWSSDEYPWCGWHGDVTGNIGNEEMYHIHADTSLSLFDGFNIDRDNSHFDEYVLTEHSTEGEFRKLPTEDRGLVTGFFGEGLWEYTDDPAVSSFLDEEPDFDVAPPLDSLKYIEFRSGADVWGFDPDTAHETWLRLRFDALLTDVDDMEALDRNRVRYEATESVVELLDKVGYNDQISIVVNENTGLNGEHGVPLTDDVDEVRDALRNLWMDPGQTDDFISFNVAESFSAADAHLNQYGEHDDQAIVLITGGHEPMRPADAWYENIVDGIHDVVPDWITDLTGWERLNEERPEPHEVGAQLDQEFIQLAQNTDAEVITLGLGPAHDGYRLAATADAAIDGEDPCLTEGPDSEGCNYTPVEDVSDLEAALSDALFAEVSWLDVNRSHTTLSVVDGDGATVATIGENINDPERFNANQDGPAGNYDVSMEEIGTTASFELAVSGGPCDGYDIRPDGQGADASQEIELDGDPIDVHHYGCSYAGETNAYDDALYFTHGDAVTDIDEAVAGASWTAAPSEVLGDEYVDAGTLDLVDEDEGVEGVIVAMPVDDGYVLLHANVRTGLKTQFEVDILDDELTEQNDWREVEHGQYGELRGVPAGEDLVVPVEITNIGIEGTEHVTLGYESEGPGQPIVDSTDVELGAGESTTEYFEWGTALSDTVAHNTTLSVTSESDRDSLEGFTVFERGLDITLRIPGDRIDQPVNITEKVETGESVTIEIEVRNFGTDSTEERGPVPIGLAVGDTIEDSQRMHIASVGDNMTIGSEEYWHNETVTFEWTPAYGILDDIAVGEEGTVEEEVTLQTEMTHTDAQATIRVEYVPVHAEDEIDLDDPDAGEIEPIHVDIDEVEIEG